MGTFKPKVTCITATCGRHTLLERCVRFFIDQDYDGPHELLIFNNAYNKPLILNLPDLSENKKIILINSCDKRYTNLGEIYTDCLNYISEDSEIVNFTDDDDIFLPNHISEGVNGYMTASFFAKLAYKPQKSYYRSPEKIELVENTLEPSIFLSTRVLKEIGFQLTTSDQHIKWVSYLQANDQLMVAQEGTPTLIYNWGDVDIPTWKTSGDPANPNNFNNYRAFSQDHGDGIITPMPKSEIDKLYNQITKP